jgi:hypothetical protein
MKVLTSPEKFASLNRCELAELECHHCHRGFLIEKHRVERAAKRETGKYCSQTCARHARRTSQEVLCVNCKITFRKHRVELKRTLAHFCSRSCSAQYNNKRKKFGATRRSKAEDYLCQLVRRDFPNLVLVQNDRSLLPSGLEIDVFIPSLKLAIELNGPIHYYPLFGESKLKKIQAADAQKRLEIRLVGCNLLVVDISAYGYFKKARTMLEEYYSSQMKPLLEV